MTSPIISVLVPVYNVEKYLQECIDSIMVQDFRDFELILVDDGSTDSSSAICDEYLNAYPNIIKVIHKENEGVLVARKVGVMEARGKYLVFWDSDDFVPKNSLSRLYSYVRDGYFDVVRAAGIRVNKGKETDVLCNRFEGECESPELYLQLQYEGKLLPYLWNGIYKASLFSEKCYDIAISNQLSLGDDWVINMIVGKNVHRSLVVNDYVYCYRYNQESIMGTSIVSLDYHKRVEMALKESGVYDIPCISSLQRYKWIGCVLSCCFKPELHFPKSEYTALLHVFYEKNTMSELCNFVDRKFTKFVQNKYLFFLYSRCYCLLFWIFKLKGKTRTVLY